jgi:Flp pilus assembly pilin Flp
MQAPLKLGFRLARDGRGFTRLEFGLLTAMLCAMVVNGIVTLGGGLGSSSKPMGAPVTDQEPRTVAELKTPASARTP